MAWLKKKTLLNDIKLELEMLFFIRMLIGHTLLIRQILWETANEYIIQPIMYYNFKIILRFLVEYCAMLIKSILLPYLEINL